MRSDAVRLFQTLPQPCGYFPERTAQNLVIDPSAPGLSELYELGLVRGYRRAGGHVYVPHCAACRACVACRVAIDTFKADRSQSRCARRNADLDVRVAIAEYNDERYDLYQRYLQSRHPDGGMDEAPAEDFARFLFTAWSATSFVELRADGRLVAVAVTDFCSNGLSAVYTLYDPAATARGLGTFAILTQIELARARGLDYLYLGFWIDGHPKMGYKTRFRPIEILQQGQWQTYVSEDPPGSA